MSKIAWTVPFRIVKGPATSRELMKGLERIKGKDSSVTFEVFTRDENLDKKIPVVLTGAERPNAYDDWFILDGRTPIGEDKEMPVKIGFSPERQEGFIQLGVV